MNINHLRTPGGLDYYLNVVMKTLPVKLPDSMLNLFLWQKIKNDYLKTDEKVNQLFVDDNKKILVIKINDEKYQFIIGYLHILDDMHLKSSNYVSTITKSVNNFIMDLKKLTNQNNWDKSKLFLITTYRLSGYNQIRLDKFPNDIKYLYITDSPDLENKKYEITLDTEINEYMEGDILLKGLLNFGANNFKGSENLT